MGNFMIRGYGEDALGKGLSKQKHGKELDDRLKNRGTAKNRRPSKMYAESGPRSGSRVDKKITELANEILAARHARKDAHKAKKEQMKIDRQKQEELLEAMGLGGEKDKPDADGYRNGGSVNIKNFKGSF